MVMVFWVGGRGKCINISMAQFFFQIAKMASLNTKWDFQF